MELITHYVFVRERTDGNGLDLVTARVDGPVGSDSPFTLVYSNYPAGFGDILETGGAIDLGSLLSLMETLGFQMEAEWKN